MFDERLARARAARARLLDAVAALTDEGPRGGPYRGTPRPSDPELELLRAEAEVQALERHARRLRARWALQHRGLRPSRATRIAGWVAVTVAAGLVVSSLGVAVVATVRSPAAAPASRVYERRLSFTGHRPPEACLAIARAVLGRTDGAGYPAPVWLTPHNLRVYTWRPGPSRHSGSPDLAFRRWAAWDDSDWRYAIDVHPGFGYSRVTIVGRDQTCTVEPSCFGGPYPRCFPLHDAARLEQEMAVLEAYLRASC